MSRLVTRARWLILVALVLLAHLVLMRSLPVALYPTNVSPATARSFETRTLTAPTELAPLPPDAVVRAKPRARPAVQHRPKPPIAPPVEAPADTPESTPQADAAMPAEPMSTVPPAAPASEPDLAPTGPDEPPQLATPSARETPLRFSAESLSASTRLTYNLTTNKFPFTLNAELLWLNLGDTYNARLRYSAFGQTREQTSLGQITPTGLAPERFADKYRSEVAAHFNHAQGKITFSANTPDAPLLSGAQDRLSVLLQLGGLLASEPARYAPGTTLTVQTVGPRSADLWLFTVIQTEPLDLPGGSVHGIKLERNPREPYDQKVEVWLSPELAYLPVRIRITEANGDFVDQQWAASEAASTP